ncbi:MAG: carbamoyl-phosphate synthase small subunit [Gammaproteobacteria bacterium CG22_combo_CG10-13_8_21_14_all_40_8]|nr:MAG: carbamoyl-phosphate synthase small subunit [Gammaproteobacteria bacterium CG22_combo_CG10-13_8_21_14_all_40_8]
MSQTAILALEDGTLFYGRSIGYEGQTVGEVVFNTAMTGYQEILTDPSYAKQLVTLTYPHIGNTGVTLEDEESSQIWAAGLIIRDLPLVASSWRSQQSLQDYLIERQIVAISEIDTRQLTRILRDKGAQSGCIFVGEDAEKALEFARAFPGLKGMDLAKEVTTSTTYSWNESVWDIDAALSHQPKNDCTYHVVAYDFGVKRNILRMLVQRGCRLTVVPAKTSAQEVLDLKPDGIFLSNGPGDPEPCDYAIQAIQNILAHQIPVFGICLGHQLLALASGATTEKMKFGHHGANHPVRDLKTDLVMITSQNHGFAVQESSLPKNIEATHRSLFDGSLQGIRRTDTPAFSFQGHPEASPGPHDVAGLFDEFVAMMAATR